MNMRERILQAEAAGTLPEALAAIPYDQLDSAAEVVADLHNRGRINFLAFCESPSLASGPDHSFFALQETFCRALPRIDCSAEAASNACNALSKKAGTETPPFSIYSALSEWIRQSPARADETLALIHRDIDAHAQLVNPVLLAGATHDVVKYVEQALAFSEHPESNIRSNAVFALGQIVPTDDKTLLNRALDRFNDLIEDPGSDEEAPIAVDAALHILQRGGVQFVSAVEPLIVRACKKTAPPIRRTLAYGLFNRRHLYSAAMIDATLAALQRTDKQDIHTIKAIDSMLYHWDLDVDRTRVLSFLVNFLTSSDEAPTIDSLSDFKHKLSNEKGCVLGWYAVSLLLTGDQRLSMAASHLLPYNQTRDGLDIDLAAFSLSSPRIMFLARKILGYCLVKKEATAALLLSCLRAIPEPERAQLEHLVFGYFLINYLSAIEWFEGVISSIDPARQSIERLSQHVASYVNDLERTGLCPAFAPSERERQIQGYRLADSWRSLHKKAEQGSLLSILAHKSTILYGTASIAYVYRDASSDPERQEIAMASFEHSAEIPRLEAIDPVGLHHALFRFRIENPPT
ncbi:MAG: hypothetical protein OXL41_11490 [Nitrospinae bacterium]|nr:hypothetical protein [Nitrospinota bacterium]